MANNDIIGNISAVREWTRRFFYTREDINYFVSKINAGFKGYGLMIIGPRNKNIIINPGNYTFTLNSDGWYRGLFFFTQGQAITITIEDGDSFNYQLTSYLDIINLSPYVIATPIMTSNSRPSGYLTGTGYSSGSSYYGAFDRTEAYTSNKYCSLTPSTNAWICYEFPDPTTIYKCKFVLYPYSASSTLMRPTHFELQASNDNESWTTIYEFNGTIDHESTEFTFDVSAPTPYLYYKIWCYSGEPSSSGTSYCFEEIYYYTVDQERAAYRIATPIMTSSTAPSGTITASSDSGGNYAKWKPFNQTINTYGWRTNQSFETENPWLQYQFNEGHCIKRIELWQGSNASETISQFNFQGSNDGEHWTNLKTCDMRHTDAYYYQPFDINNNS